MGIPSYLPQDPSPFGWSKAVEFVEDLFKPRPYQGASLPSHIPQPKNVSDAGWEASAQRNFEENLPAVYEYDKAWKSPRSVSYDRPSYTIAPNDTEEPIRSVSYDRPSYAQDAKALLDSNGLAAYIMSGKAGNGTARTQHLLGLGYAPEQIAAAQALINRSVRRAPLPVKAAAPAVTPTVAPKPEAQLAASLFRARQQSARNALGGLSPAEGVQRGIIPYEALAYF